MVGIEAEHPKPALRGSWNAPSHIVLGPIGLTGEPNNLSFEEADTEGHLMILTSMLYAAYTRIAELLSRCSAILLEQKAENSPMTWTKVCVKMCMSLINQNKTLLCEIRTGC